MRRIQRAVMISNKPCDLLEHFVQVEVKYYESAESVEVPQVKVFQNPQPPISVVKTVRYSSIMISTGL